MTNTSKKYIIFGPRVSSDTKEAICSSGDYEELPVSFGPFDSGAIHCELFPLFKEEREGKTEDELKARFTDCQSKVKDSHIIIVESTGEQPGVSESLEHVRSAVSTAKRYGAQEVTLIMPNTAYERQDRGFEEEGRLCSVNSEWLAEELKARGCDRVITVTPHSKDTIRQWQKAFSQHNYIPLLTTDMFAEDIKKRFADTDNVVVGAPDGADKPNDQGQYRARELAARLQNISMADAEQYLFKIGKAHVTDNETTITSFEGDVDGKDCVIIDDMIDGGSTMVNAAEALKERGAKTVTAYATHAICNDKKGPALERLVGADSKIDTLVVSDTIPEIADKKSALPPALQDRIDIVSVGPMILDALQQLEKSADMGESRILTAKIDGPASNIGKE